MKNFRFLNTIFGWLAFAVAAVTYLMTIEPTASFWDCGEFISAAYKLDVGHPPGAPFFMLTAKFFSLFTSDPSKVAMMVNAMSALASAFTILFLFWTITHLAQKVIGKSEEEYTTANKIVVLGAGLVGALAYTFSDTFWFSAVEGEVYAFSSFFTAVVFWLILKWERNADNPGSDRWLILIAYLMGLSIGVHLLNLLAIPAIVLVYYYKKYTPSTRGILLAMAASVIILAFTLYGLIPGTIMWTTKFELLFVNVLGASYNTGLFVYILMVIAALVWAIYETHTGKNYTRMAVSFILAVTITGVPFLFENIILGIFIILAMIGFFAYKKKSVKPRWLNTSLVMIAVIIIGYSSYAVIMIRSAAQPTMDQNSPDNVFSLQYYLNRQQYGDRPLLYGGVYNAPMKLKVEGNTCTYDADKTPLYAPKPKRDASEKDEYVVAGYKFDYKKNEKFMMLFPRMYSGDPNHVKAYKMWGNVVGKKVNYDFCGEQRSDIKPTFGENMRFFFDYQVNFMYWRYFMWNFSGRQNDIQGNGEVSNGNWITGIPFIDEALVGPQEDMPFDIINNKGHNVYYMLPLLLGILGLLFQAYAGKKGIQGFWITFFLFFMTGIAIVLYLNQTPYQPRERDYAYAGSFYAFCIWIGFGVAALAKGLQKYGKLSPVIAGSVATVLCLLVPIQMGAQNWDDHDRSNRYVCRDFGANYLESCEPNAVIFTNGDNDTFPLWYAQEVEGIRTDVRVCNTSYLQTDWYINQMKKQAYESDPLPISWQPEDYVQGTRDAAYVFPMTDKSIDLKTALDFVRSNDPKFKKIPGINQELDYIPAQTLTMGVDSAAVMAAGVIDTANLPYLQKEMKIDLKGKDVLGKQELIILDMLQTNDWNRPIYYAITVSPDQFVKLDPYFQQTGMAYQIVPMETQGTVRSINTEKMYDNVMNKFKWGGVNTPGVYLDENVMRMCKSYRIALFSKLAAALVAEGKNEKALNVLDKAMEVLPPENVPLDYSALSLGELYYELGQKEKAEMVYKGIADNALRSINWYFRLRPGQLSSVESDLGHNLAVLQEVLRVSKQYNPEFAKPYQEEFDNYRMAYGSVAKD